MCEQMHLAALILSAIGAINWGLVALLNFNLVEKLDHLVGAKNLLSRVVYIVIGVAGLYLLIDIIAPCSIFK